VIAVELAGAAGLGLGLGVVTGMPLGVVNLAIADAAAAGRVRFATGIGLGGAIADTVHAGIAFAGVGRLVTERPAWMKGLALAAAAVIASYALYAWRRRGGERPAPRRAHGVATGLVLTLPNPGALAAWVAVAAASWPTIALPCAVALALGVGAGSAAWFALLARWIAGARHRRLVRSFPHLALALLLALAAAGVVRAFLR